MATPDPTDVHHVLAMSPCSGDLGTLAAGEIVRIHSIYNSSHAASDVMGIMIGYVAPA